MSGNLCLHKLSRLRTQRAAGGDRGWRSFSCLVPVSAPYAQGLCSPLWTVAIDFLFTTTHKGVGLNLRTQVAGAWQKKKKKIGVFWESSRLVEFWLWLTVRLTALHHSRVCALRKGLYWVLQADFGGIGRAGDLTLSARTLVEKFGDQTFGLLSNLAYLAACTGHVIVIKLKWLTRCCLLCISEEPTMLLGGAGSPAGFEKHPESDKLQETQYTPWES